MARLTMKERIDRGLSVEPTSFREYVTMIGATLFILVFAIWFIVSAFLFVGRLFGLT